MPCVSATAARRCLSAGAAVSLLACSLQDLDGLGAGATDPLEDPDSLLAEGGSSSDAGDAPTDSGPAGNDPVDPPAPVNLIGNPGFEAGSGGWTAFGGALLQATNESPRTGARCLRATNRSDTFEGPAYNVLAVVEPGRSYLASGWVRTDGEFQSLSLSTKIVCLGEEDAYAPIASASASDTWSELRAGFSVPECELQEIQIYFEGPPAGVDFYLDDVRLEAASL